MPDTLLLFLRDLWASWIAWAGGILRMIPFIESLVDPSFRPLVVRRFPAVDRYLRTHADTLKRDLKRIALLCLFIGCYRAWVFEHNNAQAAMYGKDGKSEAWSKFNSCDVERSGKSLLADTYSQELMHERGRVDAQQGTMNTCVFALAKVNVPEPQRYTTFLNTVDPHKGNRIVQIIVATNKPQSPVNLMLSCNADFSDYEYQIIRTTGAQLGGPNARPDKRTAEIHVLSPAWTPMNPLLVTVYSNEAALNQCDLKQPR